MLHLEAGVGHELLEKSLEFSVSLLAEDTFSSDVCENVSSLRSDQSEILFFKLCDFRSFELVKETSYTGVKNADLFFSWNRNVLLLF